MSHHPPLSHELSPPHPPWPSSGPGDENGIPPLRAGDHLTLEEFERRYRAMPEETKAELINGVVYVASPVTDEYHGTQHFDLNGVLGHYRFSTPGVRGGDNSTLKGMRGTSQPQPDLLLRILTECGGRTRIDEEGYLVGGPELIAEVAYSSASYDLHEKKEAYRSNGVEEYLVWRVEDRTIDWFRLRGDRYEPLLADSEGIVKSEIFPGLWLDPSALLAQEFGRVLEVLQRGLASSEHEAFLARLRERTTRT